MDVVRGQRKNQIMLDEDCLGETNIGVRGSPIISIELELDKPFSINAYINKGSV